MQIDVLRPTSTVTNEWTVTGAATAHAALSDNSDASYVQETTPGDLVSLEGDAHTPAANHERHRFRIRCRAGAAAGTPQLRFGGGFLIGSLVTSSFASTIAGAITEYLLQWKLFPTAFATAPTTSEVFDALFETSTGTLRVYEHYIDVDTRVKPTFAGDVLDNAGVSRNGGIVSDTNRPSFTFGTLDYDGLVARSWTFELVDDATSAVVASASGNGEPPTFIFPQALPNGNYTATLQTFSTIRANDAYASNPVVLTFQVAFVPPASPALTTTVTVDPPEIEVCWQTDTPTGTPWDNEAEVVFELRRTDCNGTTTIHVEQTFTGCHVDRFLSLSSEGAFCGDPDHICEVCYEARYWGHVDGALVTTPWSTPDCETVTNPQPGNDWLRGATSGSVGICPTRSYGRIRPFGAFQPIGGGLPTVVTGTPGGRDYTLTFPVTSEADLVAVEAVLDQPLVFYQPSDQADLWMAPNPQSVNVIKVGRIREVTASFVEVEPQPLVDPASFFA